MTIKNSTEFSYINQYKVLLLLKHLSLSCNIYILRDKKLRAEVDIP